MHFCKLVDIVMRMLHQQRETNESAIGHGITGASTIARRIRIRTRLSLVLGLLLGLTFTIAIVAYSSLNNGQHAVEEIILGDGVIVSDAQQAIIAMLQARRAEKNYLLRYKQIGFAQARQIYVQKLSRQVNQLVGILDDLDAHGIKTGALRLALSHYQTRFLNVVTLYDERGHVNKGLEGKFRVTVHEIEKRVRAHNPQLLATVLQMRRHEKDYLLRGDTKYIALLHQRGEELKTMLTTSSNAASNISLVDQYLAGFNQLVAVDKQIAAGTAAFRSTVQQLKPEFDKLAQLGKSRAMRVKQNIQQATTTGKQWVLFISALSLLLGFAAAIWLSRSITRPIQAVSTAVSQFAGGDLKQRVRISGNDEVTDLSRSFNDMADELQRSIHDMEQFAYVASHDLQEPLRMVASYTELLAKRYQGQLDERADKYIHYATDGAKRMQMLIDALLTYSRVGTKGSKLAPVPVADVVHETIQNLEAAIQECDASIQLGHLPTVMADRVLLSQLLQNLIGNALKYRGEKAPEIHVTARRIGDMVQLSVADNGIGIAPEFHERIFQIFQRLHERGEYEGTGLGLALVKKIVERHGGKIWLESTEGKGAVFHFTLPAG